MFSLFPVVFGGENKKHAEEGREETANREKAEEDESQIIPIGSYVFTSNSNFRFPLFGKSFTTPLQEILVYGAFLAQDLEVPNEHVKLQELVRDFARGACHGIACEVTWAE
eukprot:6486905-Amphidinium_carterae.2